MGGINVLLFILIVGVITKMPDVCVLWIVFKGYKGRHRRFSHVQFVIVDQETLIVGTHFSSLVYLFLNI